MNYATTIDTISIQIDYDYAEQQRELLQELLYFIHSLQVYIGQKNGIVNNMLKVEHNIYANNTTLATINTGAFRTGNHRLNNYAMKYYVNIKFAGLKSYNKRIDKASNDYLLRICAFLNTRGIVFKLTELDVCIDAECAFENILAICTKKAPKTNYYALYEPQRYATTAYIEKMTKKKFDKAVLRAYSYDKRYKEKLHYDLTRFEIKLQAKYFNKYGFNIDAIAKAFNRYHVMYFDHIEDKEAIVTRYCNYKTIRKREIKKLELDKYRLLPDMSYIGKFIKKLRTVPDIYTMP